MDIVCGKASTTAEIQRLEAQLLPMGTGSLSNKQVPRPQGHVQKQYYESFMDSPSWRMNLIRALTDNQSCIQTWLLFNYIHIISQKSGEELTVLILYYYNSFFLSSISFPEAHFDGNIICHCSVVCIAFVITGINVLLIWFIFLILVPCRTFVPLEFHFLQ